jgi:hypothetical protein
MKLSRRSLLGSLAGLCMFPTVALVTKAKPKHPVIEWLKEKDAWLSRHVIEDVSVSVWGAHYWFQLKCVNQDVIGATFNRRKNPDMSIDAVLTYLNRTYGFVPPHPVTEVERDTTTVRRGIGIHRWDKTHISYNCEKAEA